MIKQWNTVRLWVKAHLWVTFLAATVVLTTLIHFYVALFVPPSREKAWKEIQVTEGMSFKAVAAALQKEGIIRYRGYFEIIGRLQGITRKVRVGYYGLGSHMSLWEVLDALRKGKVIEYEVVIPEGYNLYQIGWTLTGTPLISSDPNDFIKVATDKKFTRDLGIDEFVRPGRIALHGQRYRFRDKWLRPDRQGVDAVVDRLLFRRQRHFFKRGARRCEGGAVIAEVQVFVVLPEGILHQPNQLRDGFALAQGILHAAHQIGFHVFIADDLFHVPVALGNAHQADHGQRHHQQHNE